MPERVILVDAGPIVAYLAPREPRHSWAAEQFKSLPAPFLTCEPVLAEAFHFLQRSPSGSQRLFDLLTRSVISVDFRIEDELENLERLVNKYRSLPMSLADACLVRMAETHADAAVLTLDRHFAIYRKHTRHVIPVVMPPE